MIIVYGITLSTLVLVICGANICEDRNLKGCQRLAAIKQDMCQDNCMATLCPRTCGLCPLKCYSCDHVDHPSDCHHIVQCTNMTMSCITSQTVTSSLEKKFQLGCVDNTVCNDLYGPVPNLTQSIIRRDVDLIGGCCSSDLCNKYNEPDKIPAPTMNPVQPSGNTHGFSAACTEMDSQVCRHFSENNGCLLSCVASMCPQTCGKCSLTCYECASVDLPGHCRNRITCNGHQESCIAVESHVFNFKEGYKLGCVAKQNCKDLLARNIEGVCCDNNFCNGNYVPTTTRIPLTSTVDTTKASAQSQLGLPKGCTPSFKHEHDECPSKFVRKGHSCYFVGQHARTRHDAMNVCKYLCSRLVIISSKVENLAISQLLSQQRHQANRYWLDAYRNSSSFSGPWHWMSTGDILRRHTYSHWRPGSHDQTKPDGEHCASIGKAESRDSDNGYYWDRRSCTIHAPAICEYPLGHEH